MAAPCASVAALLPRSAALFGGAPALTVPGDGSFSFAELDRRAGKIAGGLAACGVGPGDRVVLHLANGWEWVVAYHAIARLGAVVTPANPLLTPSEVAFMATDCGAALVLAPAGREAPLRAALGPSATGRPDRLVLLGEGGAGDLRFEDLLEAAPRGPVEVAPSDLLAIGYTSGTTGRPKGAMLTHGNVFESAFQTAILHVRTAADTVVSALPFSHVYGNIVLNAGLLAGARLIAPARFEAGEALDLVARERVTLFEGVPTMYYQLLAHPDLPTADLSSLRRCTVGGQTMPVAKLREVVTRFGCPLLELWGMTELAGPALSHSPSWEPRLGSVGRPFPGSEIRIAGLSGDGRPPAEGEGELQIRGPLVMRGYWNDPEATAAAIDPAGWLSTGDIARVDACGYVTIVDRRKDMIITAGYNIYPAELEQVVAMHPAVSMVAVAGAPDAEKGELATAYVVRRPGEALGARDLDAHCRRYLAPYKTPRRFVFVDDLPKTSTGKIMRRALHAAFADQADTGEPL